MRGNDPRPNDPIRDNSTQQDGALGQQPTLNSSNPSQERFLSALEEKILSLLEQSGGASLHKGSVRDCSFASARILKQSDEGSTTYSLRFSPEMSNRWLVGEHEFEVTINSDGVSFVGKELGSDYAWQPMSTEAAVARLSVYLSELDTWLRRPHIEQLIDLSEYPLTNDFLTEHDAVDTFIAFVEYPHGHKSSSSADFAKYVARATENILLDYTKGRDYFKFTFADSFGISSHTPARQQELVYNMIASYSESAARDYRKLLQTHLMSPSENLVWCSFGGVDGSGVWFDFKPNDVSARKWGSLSEG